MTQQMQEPTRAETTQQVKIHALDPRRKSVHILGSLLVTAALMALAVAMSLSGNGTSTQLAMINIAAIMATAVTTYVIVRLGMHITELEFWIRRMGAGDLEYSVPPRGHDELTEIAFDLEVLRERSLRAQELNLVRQLSEQLQDKNQALEETMTELSNTQDQMVSKQKLAEIGELAAGIAHEVRNPLNIISNYAATSKSLMEELLETVREETDDPAERDVAIEEISADLTQNMERISSNCERASNIIQDVTNMSRAQASAPRPTEFNKLLHDYAMLAYQATRALDEEFNVSFVEDYDETVGAILCVPEEISRVFINVAQNACYATNEKSRNASTPPGYKPTIWLSTQRSGDLVTASVRDNGNGIPEEIADKIFNPFFTTKPTNEGTGLGLSMSHDIVRHHGGSITVASEPGQFTEMRIEMPTRPPAQGNQQPTENGNAEARWAEEDKRIASLGLVEEVKHWPDDDK